LKRPWSEGSTPTKTTRTPKRKGPGTYVEALTNIKIAIFKKTYPEDKLIEDDQNSILKHWGRCCVGLQGKNYHT
jgi:hypothetical protein